MFPLLLFSLPSYVLSLLCYDSSFPTPHSTQECGDGMVCYQEYYAISRGNGRVDQYFDRFCVQQRECHLRGFHNICTDFDSVDHEVQKTFEKFRLKNKESNRTSLVQSKFCCCDTQLCNGFDVSMAEKEYGLLTVAGAQFSGGLSGKLPMGTVAVLIITYLTRW